MLTLRQGFADTLSAACSGASDAPNEDAEKLRADNVKLQYRLKHLLAAYNQEVNDTARQEEIAKLKAENAKLAYRITHLTRAME